MQEMQSAMGNSQVCSGVNIGRLIERQGSVVCIPNIIRGTKRTYFNQPISMTIDCNGNIITLEDGIKTSVLADFGNKTLDVALLAPRVGGNFPDAIAITGLRIDKDKHQILQSRKTKVVFLSRDDLWAHELASTRDTNVAFAFSELHYVRKSTLANRMWKFENIYARVVTANNRCKLDVTVGGIETEPPT